MVKGRLITLVAILFIISAPLCFSFRTNADIAPIRFLGGGTGATFVENSDIRLYSYHVNIEVNEYNVAQTLSYCLFNPTNTTIRETIMIPIVFTSHYMDYEFPYQILSLPVEHVPGDWDGNHSKMVMAAELTINDITRKVLNGNVTSAGYQDIGMEGVFAEVQIEKNSFTNITLNCRLLPGYNGLEKFKYIYTAETAAFWNGTVHHGFFRLKYNGQLNHTNFTAPNAIINGSEVYSEVWDIDVRTIDANYTVTIDTGYEVPPYNPSIQRNTIFYMVIFLILSSTLVFISWLSVRQKGKR